ncbi:MAG: CDP-2,3-bis-(O-geranylgeranyl)-sn-glycerol synthase, partial [Candidatus Aenigmatarchaeota archaeon]
MEFYAIVVGAFWLIACVYAANAFPPLVRGKHPIDGGKKFRGKRLLGHGKTIEGTIGGILFGMIIGMIQIYFQNDVTNYIAVPVLTIQMVVLMCVGALLGDIIGSFIKRRLGLKRGQSAPLMDQLGFVVVALLLVSSIYVPAWEIVVFLLVITPIVHLVANILGYDMH